MRRYVSILKLTHVGRVTSRGLVGETNDKTRHSDTNHNAKPISPEEVLFRKKAVPTRFEETDFYFAHEQLPASRRLPDSDLLKAIHQFSSDFFSKKYGRRARADYRSLDETALIAIGILLEETIAETLGETGDMALVEPEQHSQELPEDFVTKALVHGSVPIVDSPPYVSDANSEDSDAIPVAKKARTRS